MYEIESQTDRQNMDRGGTEKWRSSDAMWKDLMSTFLYILADHMRTQTQLDSGFLKFGG